MRMLSNSHCCSPFQGAALKTFSWLHPGATSPSWLGNTALRPASRSLHRTESKSTLLPDVERLTLGVQTRLCMYNV